MLKEIVRELGPESKYQFASERDSKVLLLPVATLVPIPATLGRMPPGPHSRARVTMKWTLKHAV